MGAGRETRRKAERHAAQVLAAMERRRQEEARHDAPGGGDGASVPEPPTERPAPPRREGQPDHGRAPLIRRDRPGP